MFVLCTTSRSASEAGVSKAGGASDSKAGGASDSKAREAGDSIKPGAQAPGSDHKGQREIYRLSPAVAGFELFYWYLNLGLAPQALCFRLLSQAKKHHSIPNLILSQRVYCVHV